MGCVLRHMSKVVESTRLFAYLSFTVYTSPWITAPGNQALSKRAPHAARHRNRLRHAHRDERGVHISDFTTGPWHENTSLPAKTGVPPS